MTPRSTARPSGRPAGLADGIVMVTNAIMPDQLGGLQRYVGELSSALVARGIPVTVLTKRGSADLARDERLEDGVHLRRYAIPDRSAALYVAGYPAATVVGVGSGLRALSGVVHVHYPLQGAVVAASGRRYVHTFHAPIYKEVLPERRYRLPRSLESTLVNTTRRAERSVAGRASASVVLTEFMRAELAQLSRPAAERAVSIPAGIDTDFFRPGPGIEHPGLADRWPLVFTARRLVPRTGVSELIRAMPEVVARHPKAALAIAGDGQLRGDLEQLITELGLRDHVVLLGRVSDLDLRGWYRSATLFVLPTQELEGFGMSTVEALACGTPAIGTPAGGTPEVLGSLDAQLITAGISAHDLASGILALTNDPARLGWLRERARDHVTPSMSWSTIADRHLEIYERVAAG